MANDRSPLERDLTDDHSTPTCLRRTLGLGTQTSILLRFPYPSYLILRAHAAVAPPSSCSSGLFPTFLLASSSLSFRAQLSFLSSCFIFPLMQYPLSSPGGGEEISKLEKRKWIKSIFLEASWLSFNDGISWPRGCGCHLDVPSSCTKPVQVIAERLQTHSSRQAYE